LRKALISTFSISKLFGVLIPTQIIPEMHVFTLITGRIFEENPIFLTMKRNNVLNGKLKTLFRLMLMAASMNIDVNFHMVGKSRNIIH